MSNRCYFVKLPVKDIGAAAASGLQRNTLPTMGIYTDDLRTALATVYSADSSGATKTSSLPRARASLT